MMQGLVCVCTRMRARVRSCRKEKPYHSWGSLKQKPPKGSRDGEIWRMPGTRAFQRGGTYAKAQRQAAAMAYHSRGEGWIHEEQYYQRTDRWKKPEQGTWFQLDGLEARGPICDTCMFRTWHNIRPSYKTVLWEVVTSMDRHAPPLVSPCLPLLTSFHVRHGLEETYHTEKSVLQGLELQNQWSL